MEIINLGLENLTKSSRGLPDIDQSLHPFHSCSSWELSQQISAHTLKLIELVLSFHLKRVLIKSVSNLPFWARYWICGRVFNEITYLTTPSKYTINTSDAKVRWLSSRESNCSATVVVSGGLWSPNAWVPSKAFPPTSDVSLGKFLTLSVSVSLSRNSDGNIRTYLWGSLWGLIELTYTAFRRELFLQWLLSKCQSLLWPPPFQVCQEHDERAMKSL